MKCGDCIHFQECVKDSDERLAMLGIELDDTIEELKEIPACESFEGCEDDRDG